MLVIANAWGAVDANLAASSAARNAVRAFVEAPDPESAQDRALTAANDAFVGHGRNPQNSSVSIAYTGGRSWSRCARVKVTVHHRLPALRVPVIGGFGHGFDVVATETEVIDPYRSGIAGSVSC